MTGSAKCILIAAMLVAHGAFADVLRVKIGSLDGGGVLRPGLAAGGTIAVEVICAADEEVEIEVTSESDINHDGVVQTNETRRDATVRARDNGRLGIITDREPRPGRILVTLGIIGSEVTAVSVRALSGKTARAAAYRFAGKPFAEKPWWRRFERLLDGHTLRASPDDPTDVCVLDITAWALSRIDSEELGIAHPALSHDERRVAYANQGNAPAVVIRDRRTDEQIAVIENADWPAWLPEDRGIAFVRGGALWARLFAAGQDHPLEFNADRLLRSADSDKTFSLTASRDEDGIAVPFRLRYDSASLKLLATERLHLDAESRLSLSPDGKRAIIITKLGTLAIVDRGGATRAIEPLAHVMDPAWSSNGRSVVFVCSRL